MILLEGEREMKDKNYKEDFYTGIFLAGIPIVVGYIIGVDVVFNFIIMVILTAIFLKLCIINTKLTDINSKD